jgi:carboxyl-terminal processing protease
MRRFGRAATLAALVLPGVGLRPEPEDLRRARAYLWEVQKHLLESYIERERVDRDRLSAAAARGMARAMDHRDFAALGPDVRAAVRTAVRGKNSMEEALTAAAEAAPGLDLVKLADHAARAMIRETGDPFSRLLTDQDMARLIRTLQGEGRDDSAGCALQPQGDTARVVYVQYGTPAYEEGIEMGDEVVEVGGRSVRDLEGDDLSELLRIPEEGVLELKVRRYGREYVFRLPSRRAHVPDARHQYLGRGVGYLRMTVFDAALVRRARTALQQMAREGMKGLILDLRHNPGGALPASIGVADLFLSQGLLITRTVSHYRPNLWGLRLPGFSGEMEFRSKVPSAYEEIPMVVLVNRASASASELLAGALRDHGRAVLVGERTFGKGVGQAPILLNSMFLQRYLYLTVLRYQTPKGLEVEGRGIEPDVPCAEERPDAGTFKAIWELRRSGALERYLDARWGPEARALAESDGFEASRWEGFEDLYRSLGATLTRDQVREELRRAARRRREAEGHVWVCDLQTDTVLQRGLVELLDRLGAAEDCRVLPEAAAR